MARSLTRLANGRRAVLRASVCIGLLASAPAFAPAFAQIPTSVTPLPDNGFAPGRKSSESAVVTGAAPGTLPPVTGVAIAPGTTTEGAIRILLEQAAYWRSQFQNDRAVESLTRVLQLDPSNADALAMLSPIQAEMGQTAQANATLARLRETHPADPRIATVELSLRSGSVDQAQLAEARRLASAGRATEAVQAYQRVFKGDTPLPGLAIEYYQTLGGSEGSYDQGRDALARMVTANPQDLRAQLAFAQIETYREGTRADGIKRLEALVNKPAVAAPANQALRDALGWVPNDPAYVDSLQAYLARNPGDADLKTKLEAARNPPTKARQDAFTALEKNRLADAEAGFQTALAADPKDKDALGGLGLVRQRQGRLPEARDLLSQAAEIDPGWEPALRGASYVPPADTGTRGGGDNGASGRAIQAQYARVANLARTGHPAEAEALLLRLMGGSGNWGNYVQLGYLQLQQGKLAQAESNFRRSMKLNPRNSASAQGLAQVLAREGRAGEAQELAARIPAARGAGGGTNPGQTRAFALRDQARTESDPARRVALLREAVAADNSFPWTKLELARALDAQNQHAEATRLMETVTASSRPTKDQVQAALIYAREQGDVTRAAQLVALVPAKDRTPDMEAVQQQAALRADVGAATAGGDPAATRSRLLAVAARPDPTGTRGTEVARRLLALGDKPGARAAIQAALAATQPNTSAQRLAYVGPLTAAGYPQDARALAQQVDPARLDPLQRNALNGVQDGLAIQRADELNTEGKRADAYDALAPRLRRQPDAPNLNMALGRIYAADSKPREALRIDEAVLQRDPSDLDARHAAVDSALQSRDFGHASDLVATAEQQAPDDYRTQLMIADVARARGNTSRALTALRRARELRQQALASGDAGG